MTRLLAIIPAIFTILYFGPDALGSLLILSQVVLSLQLAFAVIPLIHFTSDKKYMKEFAIKNWIKILAWTSAAVIVYLNIHLVIDEIAGWIDATTHKYLIYAIVIPIALASLVLLIYVFVHPFIPVKGKKRSQLPHGQALDIAEFETIKYNHIAVAIDFSGNDQRIIRSALNQGGKTADYTFIHVVESAAARYLGKNTMDYETQLDSDSLSKYKQNLEELGYKADFKIGFGNAATEISRLVAGQDIDLLVMGGHGHKGLKDLIFGTTVDAVRHRINIPLLIVN